MKKIIQVLGGLSFLALISACGGTETKAPAATPESADVSEALSVSCEGGSGISVFCGFENPEDLVITPGGNKLLVSEMGEFMIHPPGDLVLFDLASGARELIAIDWQGEERWGSEDCAVPEVELFSPHGIDLIKREDGRQQLLVVNHGGRESVEFFELQGEGEKLIWRGCALPPGDPFINDVAGLKDGGFFVTHMWNKSMPFEEVAAKLIAGEKIGWVYEWQADTGFVQLPNSIEQMPNGIAVNADNSKIFVNIYMGNKTIRIDRASGEVEGAFSVQQPDNITVDESGNLWVASHKHDPINQTCTEPGVCLLPFEIVKANPDTLETEVVLSHSGAPMGYSTVALRVGDKVYMGSAHGDRVASYPIP
jgi:sugar lactone lactonase YvrE